MASHEVYLGAAKPDPNAISAETTNFAFAYARFSAREAFLGVIYRGVCRECLRAYIEEIQNDRHLRGELLMADCAAAPWRAVGRALAKTRLCNRSAFACISDCDSNLHAPFAKAGIDCSPPRQRRR